MNNADIKDIINAMGPFDRSARVMNTELLKRANQVTLDKGYNRALSDDLWEVIDSDGLHIAYEDPVMSRFESHAHRCKLLVKLADKDEGAQCVLDIDHDFFEHLPRAVTLMEAVASSRECVECETVMPHTENDYICVACRAAMAGPVDKR